MRGGCSRMKVIFLDVDGVLNFDGCKEKIGGVYFVNDNRIKLLKEIVETTGAKLVLSSDWRYWWDNPDESFKGLVEKLRENGMELFSKTPITKHGYRGAEIYQWLNEWQGEEIESFVILDDGNDMKPYMDRLVQTSYKHGLTRKDVKRAIKLLNE